MASLLLRACIMSVVLFLFSAVPTFAGNYILDIHGKQVGNSVDYYIVPQLYGSGGLIAAPRNTSSCPDYMLRQLVYSAGSPFSIAPISTSTQYLTTGQPVALYFTHTQTTCNNLLRWSVKPNKYTNYQSYVIIDGDQSLQFNSSYYFTIELTKDSMYGYNIKFCQNGNCNGLGFINGVLGVKPSDPFPFVFVQA